MESKYLYLILDLGSFIVPFAFSFYPKADFSKEWKYSLPGIFITAIIFLIWDEIFTRMGVWGFNDRFITGIYLISLPLEEVMFFVCIPYACLFTFFALNYLIKTDAIQPYAKAITMCLIIFSVIIAVAFITQLYTTITFFSVALLLTYRLISGMYENLGRFYLAFLILMIPFFIVNGILTGSWINEPIVWYNNSETIGLRIGTIPFEDCFYAMLMILLSVTIAQKLKSTDEKNSPSTEELLSRD